MFKRKKKGNRFLGQSTLNSQFVAHQPKKAINRKISKPRSRKFRLILLILIILLIALIWITFFTGFFLIKRIDISETKYIPATTVEKLIWKQAETRYFLLPQNRLPFFSKQKLIKTLNNNFQLKNLQITKKFPATLKVSLTEKEFTVIWNEAGQFHYINNEGDIILSLDQPQENQIVIYNQGNALLKGKKIKINPEIIKFINDLNDRVNAKEIIRAKEFVVDNDLNTIKMKEERGPLIFFNVNAEIDKQVTKLEALIKELGDNYDQEHYIDLRFGDRIFYQ